MTAQRHNPGVIRADLIAHKLAAIRNGEYPVLLQQVRERPRLPEMLLFLQYVSMQAGGLFGFCESLIREYPECFGTSTMLASGSEPYDDETKIKVWREIPGKYLPEGWPNGCKSLAETAIDALMAGARGVEKLTRDDKAEVANYLKQTTAADFRSMCFEAARINLPGYLAALCVEIDKSFTPSRTDYRVSETWYMAEPAAVVLKMMDHFSAAVASRLAMTETTKRVYDALDYSREANVSVIIEGCPNSGKTESGRCYCEARPGLARFISVRSGNSIGDLLLDVAEALGMDTRGSRQGLKQRIEYVFRQTALFPVLDRGASLLPSNYTSVTAPARLNWLRDTFTDRKRSVAILVEPDAFNREVRKFAKKTRYTPEEILGVKHHVIRLSEQLSQPAIFAVARAHLPLIDERYVHLVACRAEMAPRPLEAVEQIAKRASYVAGKAQRVITVADIQEAVTFVVGAQKLAVHGELPARATVVNADSAKRSTTLEFPSSSLRGAVPEREHVGLIPADS